MPKLVLKEQQKHLISQEMVRYIATFSTHDSQKDGRIIFPTIRSFIEFLFLCLPIIQIKQQNMKEEVRTDEQLQAMLSKYSIIEPQLQCPKSNPVSRICIHPECGNQALICNELNCEACGGDNHHYCMVFKFKAITDLLRKRAHDQREFNVQVFKIQNMFLQAIHDSRQKMFEKYYLGDLQGKYLKIVQQIYKKHNTKYISGSEGKQFYQRLMKSNQKLRDNANILLQSYKVSIKKMISSLIDLKKRLYESFVKVTDLSKAEKWTIDSNIIKTPICPDLNQFKFYDSLIVKHSKELLNELRNQQKQYLRTALNNPKKLELLYRGSQNGFSAAAFHQKCDNIPNTLTIVRTEFGKTIAGFSQYTWNAASSGNYVNDAGKNAFLLSLDLKQKMIPVSQNNLIQCNTGYGPLFGNGCDLYISNECNNNRNSGANFPKAYNYQGQNKYTNNQNSYRAFSGAIEGRGFRVVQYQVFRVVFN